MTKCEIYISDDQFLATVDVDGETEIVVGKCTDKNVVIGRSLANAYWRLTVIDGDIWCVTRVAMPRITRWLIEMRNRGCLLDQGPLPLASWWDDGLNDFRPSDLRTWLQEAREARLSDI